MKVFRTVLRRYTGDVIPFDGRHGKLEYTPDSIVIFKKLFKDLNEAKAQIHEWRTILAGSCDIKHAGDENNLISGALRECSTMIISVEMTQDEYDNRVIVVADIETIKVGRTVM